MRNVRSVMQGVISRGQAALVNSTWGPHGLMTGVETLCLATSHMGARGRAEVVQESNIDCQERVIQTLVISGANQVVEREEDSQVVLEKQRGMYGKYGCGARGRLGECEKEDGCYIWQVQYEVSLLEKYHDACGWLCRGGTGSMTVTYINHHIG
jgi:hypothetical protein